MSRLKIRSKRAIRSFINLFKGKIMVPVPTPTNSKMLLDGKTALITGGSGGIGFAIAEEFVRNGCNVVIAGTNTDKLHKCMDNLSKIGGGSPEVLY